MFDGQDKLLSLLMKQVYSLTDVENDNSRWMIKTL